MAESPDQFSEKEASAHFEAALRGADQPVISR
jgi:hypothetical protein